MKHRNIIHIEKMGSNDQRERENFCYVNVGKGAPGTSDPDLTEGARLADAVISGPPTRLVLQLLANWKLEQTIARRVERKKKLKLKKRHVPKCMLTGRERENRRREQEESDVFSSFSRLPSLIVPSIVRIRERVNWQWKNVLCRLISSLSPSQS